MMGMVSCAGAKVSPQSSAPQLIHPAESGWYGKFIPGFTGFFYILSVVFFSGFLPSTVFLFVNFYKIPILESNLESWFQKFSKNPRLMVHIHVGLAQVPYELGQERWRFPTSLPKNPHVRLVRDVQSYQLSARSRKVPGTKRTKPPCHATSGLKP